MTTSSSRGRSSRRPRRSMRPRTSSTAIAAVMSCRRSLRPRRAAARGCTKPRSVSKRSAQRTQSRYRSRGPARVKEAKRRLEEELWTEQRANDAYEAYRARGVDKRGRALSRGSTKPYTAARDPGRESERDRPGLQEPQSPARLHPGLQRPGRRQRAPDRDRRRDQHRLTQTSATSAPWSTPHSANSKRPASASSPA